MPQLHPSCDGGELGLELLIFDTAVLYLCILVFYYLIFPLNHQNIAE